MVQSYKRLVFHSFQMPPLTGAMSAIAIAWHSRPCAAPARPAGGGSAVSAASVAAAGGVCRFAGRFAGRPGLRRRTVPCLERRYGRHTAVPNHPNTPGSVPAAALRLAAASLPGAAAQAAREQRRSAHLARRPPHCLCLGRSAPGSGPCDPLPHRHAAGPCGALGMPTRRYARPTQMCSSMYGSRRSLVALSSGNASARVPTYHFSTISACCSRL